MIVWGVTVTSGGRLRERSNQPATFLVRLNSVFARKRWYSGVFQWVLWQKRQFQSVLTRFKIRVEPAQLDFSQKKSTRTGSTPLEFSPSVWGEIQRPKSVYKVQTIFLYNSTCHWTSSTCMFGKKIDMNRLNSIQILRLYFRWHPFSHCPRQLLGEARRGAGMCDAPSGSGRVLEQRLRAG